MEVYNGFECYVCENKELEFVDVWTPKQHEKYVCSKCKTPYHILTEQEYEKYTKIWNEHNSCAYKLSQAQDKLHRRNMQIKELKIYKTAWENWFSIINAGATTVNECIEIAHKVLPDNFNR